VGVKHSARAADAYSVSASVHDGLRADPLLASAEHAAAAALRELPEALIVVFDRELRFVRTAGQVLERAGDPSVCGEGRFLASAFPEDLWMSMEPLFASALEGETRSREIWTSEERHCVMVDVGPVRAAGPVGGMPDGAAPGGVAVVLDITARRRADVLGQRPPGGFEEVFERAPIGMGLLDTDGRWLLVNSPLCETTGYTAEELIGTRFEGIVHPEDAENDRELRARLLAGEIPAFQIEKRYFDAAGETVSAILAMSLVRDREGAPVHYIAQLQDISERKRLEEDLRRLADHDPLTGLRNRRLFEHDLRLQVARSQRYGETAGLLVIDLDSFRSVNERHGQKIGDEVLQALGRALTRRLRQTDLVARLGADGFAVLLPHIDAEGMTVVAEGLSRVIPAHTIDTGTTVLHLSATIGSALIDRHATTPERALAEAFRAMRSAKYDRPSRRS
jgi:diguanylate cyclase (GGDEF)-like protein/PAS domain S-box-containing protein